MLQMKQDGWETDKSIILPCQSKWVSFQSSGGHETQKHGTKGKRINTLIVI